MDTQIVRAGPERIGDLEPLWAALHAHHSSMQDALTETRPLEDSWRIRKAQYEEWLAGGDAVLLIAEQGGRPVGYAVVSVGHGPATWDLGERAGELETLSVLEDARGAGVGGLLVAAARDVGRERGAERMFVGVAHTNEGALRFYEREGFMPFYVTLVDREPA